CSTHSSLTQANVSSSLQMILLLIILLNSRIPRRKYSFTVYGLFLLINLINVLNMLNTQLSDDVLARRTAKKKTTEHGRLTVDQLQKNRRRCSFVLFLAEIYKTCSDQKGSDQ